MVVLTLPTVVRRFSSLDFIHLGGIKDVALPMETDDGNQSPVPTMHSDYEPFKKSHMEKKLLAHLHPEVVSDYSGKSKSLVKNFFVN